MSMFSQCQYFGDTNPLFWKIKGWCEGPNKPRTDLTGKFCRKMLGVIQRHRSNFGSLSLEAKKLDELYNYYLDRLYGFDYE